MTKHHSLKLILWILFFIVLFIALFILGLVVGYSKIGDGSWQAVFQMDTWKHIMAFWQ